MSPVTVVRGTSPIVLAQPHSGTFLPADIGAKLTERGAMLADTDWHIPQLYDGLVPQATVLISIGHGRHLVTLTRPVAVDRRRRDKRDVTRFEAPHHLPRRWAGAEVGLPHVGDQAAQLGV